MRALVTGGAGFIGSHIVDALLSKGWEVRVLDALLPPVHPDGQPPQYLPRDLELIVADICDGSAMERALHGVDIVFHQAAHQGFLPNFSEFFRVNSAGTALIYETIVRNRLDVRKVVIASSQAVYGEGRHICVEHGPQLPPPRRLADLEAGRWEIVCPVCGGPMQWDYTSEDCPNPHTQYAISKFTQEMIGFRLGQRHGIPTVALRYSITQGPRHAFTNAYSGILRILFVCYSTGRQPVIYEDGLMLRDYVHVQDVVQANLLVAEDDRADFEAFNVGSGRATSVLEYAQLIAEVMGTHIQPTLPGEFRLGDVRHIVSSIDKLSGLGWRPERDLRTIVSDYVQWAQAQGNIVDSFGQAYAQMKDAGAVRSVGKLR